MNKHPYLKLQSSLSLEDLLDQPSRRNSQNWLLTYLDVFVLIVMLVITLITLSDINHEEQQAAIKKSQSIQSKKSPAIICPPVIMPAPTTCPAPVIAETKPAQRPQPSELKVEVKPVISNENIGRKEVASPAANAAEIKIAEGNSTSVISKPTDGKQAPATLTDEQKLQQQLTKTIDGFGLNKSVNIKVTQGYAQLEIQDKVLFKSSEADLTPSGQALVKRLIPILKQAVGLIMIEGHTDNIPIKSTRFPSNWELGSSRATSVLHFLASQKLDKSRLRAITYADTMPIADNLTPEGREKNRRVNILIKFSGQ